MKRFCFSPLFLISAIFLSLAMLARLEAWPHACSALVLFICAEWNRKSAIQNFDQSQDLRFFYPLVFLAGVISLLIVAPPFSGRTALLLTAQILMSFRVIYYLIRTGLMRGASFSNRAALGLSFFVFVSRVYSLKQVW